MKEPTHFIELYSDPKCLEQGLHSAYGSIVYLKGNLKETIRLKFVTVAVWFIKEKDYKNQALPL